MSFISCGKLKDKYNWVDAKEIAKILFNDYAFEMYWAEDAWNILMFNNIVKERNIVESQLDDHQKGDIIIWLLTFYHFYFDFKCAVGYETAYFDHDVGFNYATYRSLDLFGKFTDIEDSAKYVTKYLWKDVLYKLNDLLLKGELSRQIFYDVENDCFAFLGNEFEVAYHPDGVEDDSIAKLTLLEEIQLRRNCFVECINRYFDYDESKIVDFLTGYRWIQEYSEYRERKEIIERAYAFKIRVYKKEGNDGFKKYKTYQNDNYENLQGIIDEMQSELDLLEERYEYEERSYSDRQSELSDWINARMFTF